MKKVLVLFAVVLFTNANAISDVSSISSSNSFKPDPGHVRCMHRASVLSVGNKIAKVELYYRCRGVKTVLKPKKKK